MRILSVMLIVLLLVSCTPSQASVQTKWNETQTKISALIQQVEQLKGTLQSAWEDDAKQPDPLTHLASETSLVKQNLKSRSDLLNQVKSLVDSLSKLPEKHLDDSMKVQKENQAKYVELALSGLESEQAFFNQVATGKFMQTDLKAAAQTIEGNRDAQESVLQVPTGEPSVPVQTSSEPVAKTPKYRLNQASQLFEPIGDNPEKMVLLTFDDVPITGSAQESLRIAKYLKDQNVPAIFFVYGAFMHDQVGKDTVKAIYDLGFAIGNHTQNHPDLTTLSEDGMRQEMKILNDQIVELTGEKPRYFRPPFGSTNEAVSKVAREEGMIPMNWTYGYDWEGDYQDATALADIMVNTPHLTPGANLLLHDRTNTADAIERIVTGLKGKGYGFIAPEDISDEAH